MTGRLSRVYPDKRAPEGGLGLARERRQGERRAGEPRSRRQGRARPRLRRPLPRPPQGRLLLRLLPGRQSARRRGPDRAGLPPGLPPLRPGAARVRRAPAAPLADPHRPQPGAQLLPRPLAPAAEELSDWDAELSESELRALRDPRNWVRSVVAVGAGGVATGALVLFEIRRRGRQQTGGLRSLAGRLKP